MLAVASSDAIIAASCEVVVSWFAWHGERRNLALNSSCKLTQKLVRQDRPQVSKRKAWRKEVDQEYGSCEQDDCRVENWKKKPGVLLGQVYLCRTGGNERWTPSLLHLSFLHYHLMGPGHTEPTPCPTRSGLLSR